MKHNKKGRQEERERRRTKYKQKKKEVRGSKGRRGGGGKHTSIVAAPWLRLVSERESVIHFSFQSINLCKTIDKRGEGMSRNKRRERRGRTLERSHSRDLK